ncbi:DUF1826 domain-containing protein [Erythrobacter sp. HA6-11]
MTVFAPSAARQSSSPDVFADVLTPECNLAIWERPVLPDAGSILNGAPRDIRLVTKLDVLSARFAKELDNANFTRTAARDAFAADVEYLAEEYCALLELNELEVRVELVTTNSCRKWHADYVKARLITTYIGTGTQWLDAEQAHRVKEGGEPSHFHTMDAGAVGLFKGKLATKSPAVHRSPPIAGTGETRLLLVLNPVDHA